MMDALTRPGPAGRRLLVLLLLASTASLAQAASVVSTWNAAALEEVRRNRYGPPVVARQLALAHTCMYDAWVPYDSRAVAALSRSTPRRPVAEITDANKAKAVSYAAYRCLDALFPGGTSRLSVVMRSLGYDPNDNSQVPTTPQGIGNSVAREVLNARKDDGANERGDRSSGAYSDYTGYVPANAPMPFCLPTTPGDCPLNVSNPYRWQPLVNDLGVVQRFIAPHWENVVPFALESVTQYDGSPEAAPGPLYLRSPADYQRQMDEIIAASAGLDANRKLIVEYWADGPDSELPPGHWGLFAQFISQRNAHGIDKDVKMFFAMHNASFDAGIVAWHLKRKYDGVRPITAVRYFRKGQTLVAWGGPGRPVEPIDGGKWTPYNPGSNLTPAFPGWISGHSIFSASSAAVLRAFTGSDSFGFSTTIRANFGRVEPGVPAVPTTLSYATFTAAANEAAASRLYGGIHFADDNEIGLALGDRIGRQAWAKAQFLFDGGLAPATSSVARSGSTNNLSFPHTVDALGNRLLVVGVTTSDAGNSVSSVSYAGLPLTRLGFQNGPANDNRVELWYRLAPPAGTATVTVRTSGLNQLVAGATSYIGVNQAAPFGVLRGQAGASPQACATLAYEAVPLTASVLTVNADAGVPVAQASHKLLWQAQSETAPFNAQAALRVIGAAGSGLAEAGDSVCYQLGAPRNWSILAVPLKSAVAR